MNPQLDAKHKSSYKSGMNKRPIQKRVQILSILCEGVSMRSISRVVDVSINTVGKVLVDAGNACMDFHDQKVRGVRCKRVQVDEIWSFCGAKQKNVADMKKPIAGAGDVWTWTALDSDSKLMVGWYVGGRNAVCADRFMQDLAGRIDSRIQLTSDGLRAYIDAVDAAFDGQIDYAQLVKLYGPAPESAKGRYSPAECIVARKNPVLGAPDDKHISTSHVERHNLTMRMQMRRFTRLTNGFSKKFESHVYMVALYTVWYNWIRLDKTVKVTPAMAAGLTDKLMGFEDIVALMDAAAPAPERPKVYRKKPLQISN
jgi:IS1 family transposase